MGRDLNNKTRVVVALSGGVDSAVAAALLIQKGYAVEGVFMKNWSGDDYAIQKDCPWEQDQKDAEAVCKTLGIPFRSLNFEKEYRDAVVDYFFKEYSLGRTPNPDVMCNKEIKFKLFREKAVELGADYIATGHYAGIAKLDDRFVLKKGVDREKDQSYFLHRLTQEQLAKTMFPLGDLTKPEVRKLAKQFSLPNADKKDSQGICFIGKINVQDFLRKRIPMKPGKIVDIDTDEQVGRHQGVMFYTVGQRQGLGIGGVKKPYYVARKDLKRNILYVANGSDHPSLYKKQVRFSDLFLNLPNQPKENKPLSASIRYRHEPASGVLNTLEHTFEFAKPQKAPSAGQSIVFYQGDICLGGAIIEDSA